MYWYQKIYFNDKLLILTTDKSAYIREFPEAEIYRFFEGAILNNFSDALQNLEHTAIRGAIIEDAAQQALLDQLHILCTLIEAGGGVAFNERNEILMIYRRGKWDLPKGKRDKGETIDECALREVKEETGLKNLEITGKICDTYHIYAQYGDQLLKRTTWYKMKGLSTDKLAPQKEENILEARWVREQDLGYLVAQSYVAIREVLELAGMTWQ